MKLNFRFLCITVLPQLCFLSHKFAFFAYSTIGNCIFQVASIVSFLLNFFSPKRNVFRKHPGVGVGVWVCVGVCVCVCVGYVCVCVCGLNNAYLQISIKQFSSCLYVCTSEVRVGPPPGYFNYCTTKKLDWRYGAKGGSNWTLFIPRWQNILFQWRGTTQHWVNKSGISWWCCFFLTWRQDAETFNCYHKISLTFLKAKN